jgi:hypothetical protein
MACPSHFIPATFIMSAISGSLKDSIIQNSLICQNPSPSTEPKTMKFLQKFARKTGW